MNFFCQRKFRFLHKIYLHFWLSWIIWTLMAFWLFLVFCVGQHKVLCLSYGLPLLSWEAVWTYCFCSSTDKSEECIVFYSLLSDVVSKPFWKTAVSNLCWLLFPFLVWWGGGCFVFLFSSSFCSSPTKTLGGMKTCRSGNGDILLVKCLMLFPAIPLQLLLVSHF